MRVEYSSELSVSIDRAWNFLSNTNNVVNCFPEIENIETISPSEYKVKLKSKKIGPITLSLTLDVKVRSINPEEKKAEIEIHGSGAGAKFTVNITASLKPKDTDKVVVTYVGDVELGGFTKLLGKERAMEEIEKFVKTFFENLKSRIEHIS